MKVAIVGAGYVGLVTGLSLSLLGHEVICVDNDQNKISRINNGYSPFYEPGMDKLLKKEVAKKSLQASINLEASVLGSSVTIIAVGTPTTNNKINLFFIKIAAKQIGEALAKVNKYHVIAVKSTVLPGVTEDIVKPILEKYSGKKAGSDFGICMNPEFLREGCAIKDALHPDRIVIGQMDEKSGKEFAKIYRKVSAAKIFTNLWTAEMTKYSANALLATLISFSNEIARIAEHTGKVDIVDVWQGVHLDRRLSPYNGKKRIKPGILNYIFSGCGYGGSCFPKDTQALATFAKKLGNPAFLLNSVININKTQPQRLVLLLKKAMGENLKKKRIAVLGLAFKPNTDDIRQSPSFAVIDLLLSEGAKIIVHDPMAYQKTVLEQINNPSVVIAKSVGEAVKNSDAVILVTAWEEYLKLSPKFFKKSMKFPIVIDGRRVYDKASFLQAGIVYKGIGL
ncbi:UDP-glucose/GDP-mannose dehydrogenase family protein [Patescibacteria group bacterium]|nr:UDP-glucose/GDP-mannose dehydrogenase family protein [Patescibacteria group bacterium]